MMRNLGYIFISFMIISCVEKPNVNEGEKTKISDSEFLPSKNEYAILKFENEMSWIFKNSKPANLTDYELVDIEAILKKAEIENNKNNELGERIDIYKKKRQYIPVINSKGEKEVWINFFCDDFSNENWKKSIFIVHDGGNCFFNMKVNLTNKTFYEIEINGDG